jgi:endonuclease/exonuclease/phosphatase family metal-dependent hydrolase
VDELQRRTGVTWYGAFLNSCSPGAWNGSACTKFDDGGVGIFSSFPIVSTSSLMLPFADCWTSARPALRAALNVNGKVVQVINTHLQTGGCSNSAQQRYDSMRMIKDWARNYSTPQIVAGDFNADPDQIMSSLGMSPAFIDSWPHSGVGSRMTFPVSNPTMKLDYLMFDASWQAYPMASEVVTATGSESDHYPVRATFQLR